MNSIKMEEWFPKRNEMRIESNLEKKEKKIVIYASERSLVFVAVVASMPPS